MHQHTIYYICECLPCEQHLCKYNYKSMSIRIIHLDRHYMVYVAHTMFTNSFSQNSTIHFSHQHPTSSRVYVKHAMDALHTRIYIEIRFMWIRLRASSSAEQIQMCVYVCLLFDRCLNPFSVSGHTDAPRIRHPNKQRQFDVIYGRR